MIEYEQHRLVRRHRGTLPVLLTCPHGGDDHPDGVPERTDEGAGPGCFFNKIRDSHTRPITTALAQRLYDLTGEAPYVVIAEAGRKYIDLNRSPDCAYEDPAAQRYYDAYHDTVGSFVDEIRTETGGLGLLFDIHGTNNTPADLYIGTARDHASTPDAVRSIARLLRADPGAWWRRRGLLNLLAAAGYSVSPDAPDAPEVLAGGFTVRRHGTSQPDGLDAIQVEIAAGVRADVWKRNAFVAHLARVIASLTLRYAGAFTLASFWRIVMRDEQGAGDLVTRSEGGAVVGERDPGVEA